MKDAIVYIGAVLLGVVIGFYFCKNDNSDTATKR